MECHSFFRSVVGWGLMFSCTLTNGCKPRLQSDLSVSGGELVIGSVFPETVRLLAYNSEKKVWWPICSATLINENTLLSAAHCFGKQESDRPIIAVIGPDAFPISQVTTSERYYDKSHPNLIYITKYDLAVLTLAGSVTDWPFANLLTTPPQNLSQLTTVGYGCNRWLKDFDWPETFQAALDGHFVKWKATMEIQSGTDVNAGRITAGTLTGLSPTVCPGDSGGSIFAGEHLVGVTSSTNQSNTSYFAYIYSPESKATLTAASSPKEFSGRGFKYESFRVELTDEEYEAALLTLMEIKRMDVYLRLNQAMLQQKIAARYGERLTLANAESTNIWFTESSNFKLQMNTVTNSIVNRFRNRGINLERTIQLAPAFLSNDVNSNYRYVADSLIANLSATVGTFGSAYYFTLDQKYKIIDIRSDFKSLTAGSIYGTAFNYDSVKNYVNVNLNVKLSDSNNSRSLSSVLNVFRRKPTLKNEPLYPIFGHSDPKIAQRTIATINKLAAKMQGLQAIFVVLDAQNLASPEAFEINSSQVYYKAASDNEFKVVK